MHTTLNVEKYNAENGMQHGFYILFREALHFIMSFLSVRAANTFRNYFKLESQKDNFPVYTDIFNGKSGLNISVTKFEEFYSILQNNNNILHTLIAYNSILRHLIAHDLNEECKVFIIQNLENSCLQCLTKNIKKPDFHILCQMELFLHLVMQVTMFLFQYSSDSLPYEIFNIVLNPNVCE